MDPKGTATGFAEETRKQNQKEEWRYKLTNHTPSLEGIRRIEALRSAHKALSDAYIDLVPSSREQSIALSKLEEAASAAIGGVARVFTLDNPTYAAEQGNTPLNGEAVATGKRPE